MKELHSGFAAARWPRPADPGQAANELERWAEAAADLEGKERRFAESLAKSPPGKALLEAIFGNSPYLTHGLIEDIGFTVDLLRRGPNAMFAELLLTAERELGPPVDEAARIMRSKKINALPVTEKNRLVGILTASDVLDAFVELSGVAEPTYLLVLDTPAGKRGDECRRIIERNHGEVKWMWTAPRRPRETHVRLKTRRLGDIETALEAAGFEVAERFHEIGSPAGLAELEAFLAG